MEKILKDKKILITAGPVWVPIDKVRVMTNIFGGALGYVLSSKAAELGADVLLLMGPGRVCFTGKEKFRYIRFKYFEEIHNLLKKEISKHNYDVVIQSAAIPDYVPIKFQNKKIKSGKKDLAIQFRPTFKIIDRIKKWDNSVFLVKFKLEVDKTKKQLIDTAHKSMLFSDADLIVANELKGMQKMHRAYIIDREKQIIECNSKDMIAKKLLNKISYYI